MLECSPNSPLKTSCDRDSSIICAEEEMRKDEVKVSVVPVVTVVT